MCNQQTSTFFCSLYVFLVWRVRGIFSLFIDRPVASFSAVFDLAITRKAHRALVYSLSSPRNSFLHNFLLQKKTPTVFGINANKHRKTLVTKISLPACIFRSCALLLINRKTPNPKKLLCFRNLKILNVVVFCVHLEFSFFSSNKIQGLFTKHIC